MVFPLCNVDLASTLFIPADDLINGDDDGDDDEDDLQAEPSRQTGNTTDTGPSVFAHVARNVRAFLPLIFHFALRYLRLRTRELHLNSSHFDFPVVLMWWNISCRKTHKMKVD